MRNRKISASSINSSNSSKSRSRSSSSSSGSSSDDKSQSRSRGRNVRNGSRDRRGRHHNYRFYNERSPDRRDRFRGRQRKRSASSEAESPPRPAKRNRWEGNQYERYNNNNNNRNHSRALNPVRNFEAPPPPVAYQNQRYMMPTQDVDYPTQPHLMTFKQFITTQEDNIDEAESLRRYTDYKTSFRKEQIEKYFIQHKTEEWFRFRYHPDEFPLRQEEAKATFKHRCNTFMKLLETDIPSSVSLDVSNGNDLVRLLDSVIILLEGGTEVDLKALKTDNNNNNSEETLEEEEAKRKPLHLTKSIFLRNIAPSISVKEIEAICKKYPGYMRVSIQDPQPERRFARRGWITFESSANIEEICSSLNMLRVKDSDMGAVVNRDLKQRVRTVPGICVHKSVARQDVKNAAKIIYRLDKKWKVWGDDDDAQSIGIISRNPVLQNITDFIVDEIDYEEAALDEQNNNNDKDGIIKIERDERLLKALDLMLLYLRVVYSIDYYGAFEYPNEDEMPHRCGIIHARGQHSSSTTTQTEIDRWMSGFETKIQPFLSSKLELDDAETLKLGRKSEDEEVEKFILANSQEIEPEKWFCPLSEKRFKGPEFVRKHILLKHESKVLEVRKEAAYFNNYLSDPKRPQLPEHPASRVGLSAPPSMSPWGNNRPQYRHPAPPSFHGIHTNGYQMRPDMLRNNQISRAPFDPRPLIQYTDIDAFPND